MVFFQRRHGKILIWQKFSWTWESDFKLKLVDVNDSSFQVFSSFNISLNLSSISLWSCYPNLKIIALPKKELYNSFSKSHGFKVMISLWPALLVASESTPLDVPLYQIWWSYILDKLRCQPLYQFLHEYRRWSSTD